MVSNPEFLKEGEAVNDCMRPDRIVLGSRSAHAVEQMKRLYAPFNRNHERIVVMDERSAELTKYAANAMLATKISFMNEMANIAERVGADIEMVRHGIGSDPRIGYSFIYPGAGYGGSCFPKDVQALGRIARQAGYTAAAAARRSKRSTTRRRASCSNWSRATFDGQLAGRTFAVWGLSFKPNTDDMREASSRALLEQLWAGGRQRARARPGGHGGSARASSAQRDDLVLCDTPGRGAAGRRRAGRGHRVEGVLEPGFRARWPRALGARVVFDGRNIYDPAAGGGRRPGLLRHRPWAQPAPRPVGCRHGH